MFIASPAFLLRYFSGGRGGSSQLYYRKSSMPHFLLRGLKGP
jgi:hypothetical protein